MRFLRGRHEFQTVAVRIVRIEAAVLRHQVVPLDREAVALQAGGEPVNIIAQDRRMRLSRRAKLSLHPKMDLDVAKTEPDAAPPCQSPPASVPRSSPAQPRRIACPRLHHRGGSPAARGVAATGSPSHQCRLIPRLVDCLVDYSRVSLSVPSLALSMFAIPPIDCG